MATHLDPSRFELTVCILGNGGTLASELRARGVAVHVLGQVRRLDVRALGRFHALLRETKVQLVHANAGGRAVRLIARLVNGPPVITHIHNIREEWVKPLRSGDPSAERLLRNLPIGADRILTCSEWLASAVRRALPNHAHRISVLSPGVDTTRFAPEAVAQSAVQELRQRLSIPPGPVIVFVGRLVRQKGIARLVDVARMVERTRPDVSFVIVGDGPLSTTVHSAMSSGEVTNVRLAGSLVDVRPAYALADLAVMTSEWEPFGLVNLEAAAMRKAVVAPALDGVPETVEDGVTGVLIKGDDPREFASEVLRLLDDRRFRETLGAAGQRTVRARFDARLTSTRAAAIYEDTIRIQTRAANGATISF